MLLLPSQSNAQVEDFASNRLGGGEIVEYKTVTPKIIGANANLVSMGTAYIILFYDESEWDYDWEYETTKKNKKKDKNKIQPNSVAIYIPYTVNQKWTTELDRKYNSEMSIHIRGDQNDFDLNQHFGFSQQGDGEYTYDNAYSATDKGIFGEIEYNYLFSQRNKSQYEGEFSSAEEVLFSSAVEVLIDIYGNNVEIDLRKETQGDIWAYEYFIDAESIYKKINSLTIQVDLSPSRITSQQYDALETIKGYCEQLNNWDMKKCTPELFNLLKSMRDLRLKENIGLAGQTRFIPIEPKTQTKLRELLDSCARKGNPDAMLWSARINYAQYHYGPLSNCYPILKQYVTLATQGNADAIQDLKVISPQYLDEETWVAYLIWLKQRTDIGLYSPEFYNGQMQYIKKNVLDAGNVKPQRYNDYYEEEIRVGRF